MKDAVKIIRAEFHRSAEARYIHRLHAVLLVLLGLNAGEAARLLGDPRRTVAHWIKSFEAHGLESLSDAEKSGRPERLTPSQKQFIARALHQPPKKFGFTADKWTNVLLERLIKKRYSITLSLRQCSRILLSFQNQTKS